MSITRHSGQPRLAAQAQRATWTHTLLSVMTRLSVMTLMTTGSATALAQTSTFTSPGERTREAQPRLSGLAPEDATLTVEITADPCGQPCSPLVRDAVQVQQGGAWSYTTPTPLAEGDYLATAQLEGSPQVNAQRRFTVDQTPPAPPRASQVDTSVNPPRLSGEADPADELVIVLDLGAQQLRLPPREGPRWEATLPSALDETQPYHVELFTLDGAGNRSTSIQAILAFEQVVVREYKTNTPQLNGLANEERVLEVQIRLWREPSEPSVPSVPPTEAQLRPLTPLDQPLSLTQQTDASGAWALQFEEPLAPGLYTALIQYQGLTQFELYKLRIPYVPADFERGYCASSSSSAAERGGLAARVWWMGGLALLAWRLRTTRRRPPQGTRQAQ